MAAPAKQYPCEFLKVLVFRDGDELCVLYGHDLESGVAGFGDSVEEAKLDFDWNWEEQLQKHPH